MAKNLVIIESPNKIKTIAKYLGNDYQIMATIGHIRDIPQSNAKAFDPKTYEPSWKIITKPKSKEPIINEIKSKAKKAKKIYLATDPDREGEAIAWHVYDILSQNEKDKCTRITFNEITKEAIANALKHERKIQNEWVHSQFVRRILDRIIGYDLSKFVHKKFSGVSAGRVQSVVLKFLDSREKEIAQFKPTSWFTLDVDFSDGKKITLFELKKPYEQKEIFDDKKSLEINFKTKQFCEKIKTELKNDNFVVYLIEPPKTIHYNSKDPYKTSTLQQDAITKLGWNLTKITKIIQELYEGVQIDDDHLALISYPRTDSIRMADSFILKAKSFIQKTYGKEYVLQTKRSLAKQEKKENIQDAHECIRVIDPFLLPEDLKNKISLDHYEMYKLIWQRTIASLMAPAIVESTITRFDNNGYKFFTTNKKMIFAGFKILYPDTSEETIDKQNYKLKTAYKAKMINVMEHTSKPPERYTQASLIKTLDESGVGRPSTYKLMADIGLARGYCQLINKAYHMTKIGSFVIDGLNKYFDDVINKDFTKKMEERLDDIANCKEQWNKWLLDFAPKFQDKVKEISQKVKTKALNVGRTCPKCGKPLVYRFSKISKKQFVGCSNFPQCKYTEYPNEPKQLDIKCPSCGHNLVEKTSKWGKKFIGCSNFPHCHFICQTIDQIKSKNS